MLKTGKETHSVHHPPHRDLQPVLPARVGHILRRRRTGVTLQGTRGQLLLGGSSGPTHLCVGAVDPLQAQHPVGGAVECVQVVLDHLGCTLSWVVAGVQLSCRHGILDRLLRHVWLLSTGRERERGKMNDTGVAAGRGFWNFEP